MRRQLLSASLLMAAKSDLAVDPNAWGSGISWRKILLLRQKKIGVTPPVALASYTAAGIAGSNPNRTGMTALRLAVPGFLLPFLLVYRPELLGMHTTLPRFLISTGVAVVACLSTACCTHGYFMGKLSLWERVLMGVGSLMLVNPDMWLYVGVALIVSVLLYRWYRARTGMNRAAGAGCNADMAMSS
ncbi:MAG: hypothetical protein QME92_08725 [Bacillota bacterium]|nr:hypothetical protein [Bacillota bacterium]